MKEPSASAGVFSHSAVKNDQLKNIQTLHEEIDVVSANIGRNETWKDEFRDSFTDVLQIHVT